MSSKNWKREDVDRVKARIRDEILAIKDDGQRLPYLLERIQTADGDEPDRIIYIHAAIHTHLRLGGLSEAQVKELIKLSETLLTLRNIKPRVSPVAFLLAELHALEAQLHRLDGEPLLACIQQQLVQHVVGTPSAEDEAYHQLALAQNVLRMGDAELCLDYVERCLGQSEGRELRSRAEMLKLRALRLSLDFTAAEEWSRAIAKSSDDPRWARELAWEGLCREVHRSGKIDALILKVNPRHDFYHASYILEGFCWAKAVSTVQWLNHLPKLKSLSQKKQLNFKPYPAFFRCAQSLERIYDKEIPFLHRLSGLSRNMQAVRSLPDVDKALLVTLALVRWLLRNQCHDLARIIWGENVSLSLRLSRGKSADVLGIATDLMNKSWD